MHLFSKRDHSRKHASPWSTNFTKPKLRPFNRSANQDCIYSLRDTYEVYIPWPSDLTSWSYSYLIRVLTCWAQESKLYDCPSNLTVRTCSLIVVEVMQVRKSLNHKQYIWSLIYFDLHLGLVNLDSGLTFGQVTLTFYMKPSINPSFWID